MTSTDPGDPPIAATDTLSMAGADVAMVRWPGEEDRLDRLRSERRPRLLLVESGAAPPLPSDDLEDWIRVPAQEVDMMARLAGLERRFCENDAICPEVDEDGVLRMGRNWVSLPPVDFRLAAVLVERFGAVVSRDALARAGWPERTPARNALDVHVLRLRRRLEPLGLAIRTVRSRGYALEQAERQQVSQA
ncbi:MAG: winged helix-turn-helix domain-containing protein [Acidimicrobiales bacterium]